MVSCASQSLNGTTNEASGEQTQIPSDRARTEQSTRMSPASLLRAVHFIQGLGDMSRNRGIVLGNAGDGTFRESGTQCALKMIHDDRGFRFGKFMVF